MAFPEDMYLDISSSRKFLPRLEDSSSSSSVAGRLFLRPFSWDFRDAIWSSTEAGGGTGFFGAGTEGGGGGESSIIIGAATDVGTEVRSIVSRIRSFVGSLVGFLG